MSLMITQASEIAKQQNSLVKMTNSGYKYLVFVLWIWRQSHFIVTQITVKSEDLL